MACEVITPGNRPRDILSFLTGDEKQQVSPTIAEKLNKEWSTNLDTIEKLEIEIEKVATDSDQQKFLLEKQILATQEKLDEEGRLRSEASNQIKTLKEEIASHSEELQKANDKTNSLNLQLEQYRSELASAIDHSTAISGRLETKTQLLNGLQEQLRCLEEQLLSTQQSKCDAMIQAEEANALQIQLQFKERRYEQEKNLLSNQVDLLEQQLEERHKELLTLRNEHSITILSLQSDLAHSLEELKLLREEKESFQHSLEEKSKKIKELLSTINDMRISETRLEESFQQELMAQKKVSSIYKASGEDKSKRCEELEKAIEELRQLLREASEQYGALERAKALAEEEAQKSIDESTALIKDLHDELDKANELMQNTMRKDDALAEMSPAAAAASHLMSKGMTLTQLYAEYISTSENLFHSKEENKRLSRYIEQILEELQDKAPLMRQQKEDYQRALETINVLNTQIIDAIEDLEKQRIDAEEAQRRANFLGRENDRLSQQVKDLGKQVTILLTQVEAARVGLPPPPVSVLDNMSLSGASSSDIIDQHLITFRDVSELQVQNQKLLASLRDVTERLESAENDAVSAKTKALQSELEEAKKQLDDLRNSREKMQTILENVSSQRDTYRTIVNQQSTMTNGVSCTGSSPSASRVSSKEVEKLKGEKENLQMELTKAKKEHEEYRMERNKNEQLEKNEFERIKSSFEKTRSENIRLLSHAEYNDERLKTLQNSCEGYQRQVNAHIEKSNAQQGIIGKHEATIECLRENVLDLTKRLSHAEVMTSNIKKEKDILKESESRLMAERDSLHRSQYSQSLVLSNLEAIKNNLERSDSGAKMRYENQIADLTEHCSRLKAKIEANTDIKEATLRLLTMEEQLKKSFEEAETLKKSLNETEQQLLLTKSQLLELQDKCKITPPQTTTPILSRQRNVGSPSPGPLSSTPSRMSPAVSQTVRELQVQLTEERAKSGLLKANADEIQKAIVHLKILVEELETQLKNSTDAKNAAQEEINSLRKELNEAEKIVKQLKEDVEAHKESEKALKDSMDHRLMKMTEDLEERENELEEVQKRYDDSKKAEDLCRIQMNEQIKLAQDMQNKYEREVMLHGSDLTALVALKEKLADYNSKLEAMNIDKLKAEEQLKDSQTGFEKHEKEMQAMCDSLKNRERELDEQNRSLLEQFTSLSDKMAAIQSKLSSSSSGDISNVSFTEDEARSSEQLREIIKYLRRERDLSTGKSEMAHAESERLGAQKRALENQVEFLSRQLADERAKNTSTLETAGKYEEIMRKVHTMDALSDSNRLLREEKRALENSLHEYTAKSNSLKIQIEPLQERNKELQTKLENYLVEEKALEKDKELLKKRVQELVEKLNKSKPEDMIQLQQEIHTLQEALQGSDVEISRHKNMNLHYQKSHQQMTLMRNQVSQQLTTAKEENKKLLEDNKKLTQEKLKMSQQIILNTERIQALESSHESLQQQKNQLLQQITELRQKDELAKREMDTIKQLLETKENQIKELAAEVKDVNDKIIVVEKKNDQLRKIATKYKKKAETLPDTDSGNVAGEEDLNTGSEKVRELEEKISLLLKQLESAPKKEELDKLRENIEKLETEHKKKEELLAKYATQRDGNARKNQLESVSGQLADLSKRFNETKNEKLSLDSKIAALERENEQFLQQIEVLNKKLQMQQKQLENLQKQLLGGSKGSTSGIIIEKPSSDPPPTANIKPMAAPSPAVSSPRSQVASQGGSSRSIPTASIRPMAPSSGQPSSVVVVQPMESHSSGDGAVSSTVTLPQATVTPTPVAPTSTPTQAYSSTLTATVSPTPMSACSVASTSPFTQPQTSSAHLGNVALVSARQDDVMDVMQMPSGSADALISQAIAMVVPQVEDRSSQKRKFDASEGEDEVEEEGTKRSRLIEEDVMEPELQIEEEEQEMEAYEDAGEPSSSSSHPTAQRQIEGNNEVLILSSDDEGEEPSSQTEGPQGRSESQVPQDEDESQDGGREAEAELSTEPVSGGDGSSQSVQSSSSSLQPPPSRPAHEHPSSSRQSLAPFHQLPQYEEGADDRTVPSTPTLFVSRPCESAPGDGVSSPQVPSQGFEFVPGGQRSSSPEAATHSTEGLSQIAEGGTIDVTRMDLGQLDHEGSHRRSPAVEVCTEGNISSSGGEQESGDSHCVSLSPLPGEASTNESEADSGMQGASRVSESSSHQDHEAIELNEERDEHGHGDRGGEDVVSSQEPHLGEVESPNEDDDDDEQLVEEEDDESQQMEEEYLEEHVPVSPPLLRATRSSAQAVPLQRRVTPITPIVWSQSPRPLRGPSSSRGGRGYPVGRGTQQLTPQAPRFQGGSRGQLSISQRARRSRPGFGSGSPN